jgi:hypothetical protein
MAGVAFRGTVHHRGRSVTLVWLPGDVVVALGDPACARLPVRGSVAGAPYTGWARRSRDRGAWYLLVDRHLRAGDVVDVEVDHDPAPDPPGLPDDMADLLAGFPRAQAGWDDLPPSHRREYLAWIEEAKGQATRTRRIMAAIEKLREDEP